MEIVDKVAATIQNVLGSEAEELGRATGVIQRRRKFTAVSLLRMLVLTLLRKPGEAWGRGGMGRVAPGITPWSSHRSGRAR